MCLAPKDVLQNNGGAKEDKPFFNSCFFLPSFALKCNPCKYSGEMNSRLSGSKTLQVFRIYFCYAKTLEHSAIFPALTLSREKFFHLEPCGSLNRDVRKKLKFIVGKK
jgi:hypothetical protein